MFTERENLDHRNLQGVYLLCIVVPYEGISR